MDRNDIHSRLALLAHDVRADEDVARAGDRICAAAVALLGGRAEAGLSIAHRGHRVESLGGTADVVRAGDELQIELGEGPCLDAVWVEQQVVTGDLGSEPRWPTWGPRMVQSFGVQSMLSTQMFSSEKLLGALNVYSTQAHAFDEEDEETARLLAAHAGMAVAAAQQVEGLKFAVDRRTTIGKALGIVMARYDLDDQHAFTVLQRISSHENRKLFDIAQEVIDTRGVPDSTIS